MEKSASIDRAPFADQRGYALAEVFSAMAAAALGAVRGAWRRMQERSRMAQLHHETRHLSEHLLKDIGLWDKLR